MKWSTISCILCIFGFLKEFRPNEPFVTNYLTGPWKNFTQAQVSFMFNMVYLFMSLYFHSILFGIIFDKCNLLVHIFVRI